MFKFIDTWSQSYYLDTLGQYITFIQPCIEVRAASACLPAPAAAMQIRLWSVESPLVGRGGQ